MSRSHPRVLLIQIRDDDHVADHELLCFRERLELPIDAITTVNVVRGADLSAGVLRAHDAILVGGAGAHSATDNDPFVQPLIDAILRTIDLDIPMFGSCYGHQIIARALGGEVITDHATSEVGGFSVTTTAHADDDALFEPIAGTFDVLMGHHDRVAALPDMCRELAYSDRCRNQAFRVVGRSVWGTQFHAELTPGRLIERLSVYRQYVPADEEFGAMKEDLVETPVAATILQRFLDLVRAS
ncbi:MAG: type 1 glutamine amidotransferase [Planctomycetota bacterium]